jgi:ABC-2 type transport system ATP-binding protein
MSAVIQLQQISKSYGGVAALKQVSLNIPSGVTGLLGPNGSGKSTLIKGLLGLLRFDSGSAQVLDLPLPASLKSIRDRVGYLPEDDCFIAGLTGIESIRFMAELSGLPSLEALRRSHEMLDFADIGGERYRAVESYSTGMRQKLKFANALVHDPDLLILDEPTTGLDPQQREAMLKRIRTLATKHHKSILLSTHILHDVKSICDQVVILARGTVRTSGSLEELSRPLEPGLSLQVLEGKERMQNRLRADGFTVVDRPDETFWIHGVGVDQSPRIWELANQVQVSIVQMTQAKNSLEQIFIDSVKETDRAIA